MRARISVSHACGSMPFILAVTIRQYVAAARRPQSHHRQGARAHGANASFTQPGPGAEIVDRVIKFILHSRAAQLWYVSPATGLILTSESPCRGGSSSHSLVSQP
jgi:hypothetical protein